MRLGRPGAVRGTHVSKRGSAGGRVGRPQEGHYNLTPDELAAYREAIQKVMQRTDNKGYDYPAGIHGVPQFPCVHHRWDWLPVGSRGPLPFLPPFAGNPHYCWNQMAGDQADGNTGA
jgi:hypothetical protein